MEIENETKYFLAYDDIDLKSNKSYAVTAIVKGDPLIWIAKEGLKKMDSILSPKFWIKIDNESAILFSTYMETVISKINKEKENKNDDTKDPQSN